MRRGPVLLLAAIAALAIAPPAEAPASAGAQGRIAVHELGPGSAAARYWTAERLRSARPLSAARGGGGLHLRHAPRQTTYLSGPVPDPSTPPNTVNGKLYGKIPGFGRYSCSATVLDSAAGDLILTAGHCLRDPLGPWAKKLSFVPAYDYGARPYGTWSARTAYLTREWALAGNMSFDFGVIELAPRAGDGLAVESVVGGRPPAFDQPPQAAYTAVGYPFNLERSERMWSCSSGFAGEDPRPARRGRRPIGIACDMTEGASGGGWFDPSGSLVSVSSFYYRNQPGVLYGPQFGRKTAKLIAKAERD